MKAPNQIGSLVEWWNPDTISGSDGDRVTVWTGLNSHDFTGAPAGLEPLLRSANRQPANHQMVMIDRASGRGCQLDADDDGSLSSSTVTYAFIAWPLYFNAFDWVFNKQNTQPGTVALRADSDRAWEAYWRLEGSEGTIRTSPPATSYNQQARPQLIVWMYDGTTVSVRVNGEEIITSASPGALDTDNPGTLTFGNHPTAESLDRPIMFADIALFDEALSAADLADLEDWFIDRWQLDVWFYDWTTIPPVMEATPASGESDLFSPCIRELDASTWIMFGAIRNSSTSLMQWVDYWTAPKADPHNWTRNPGSPIIDATTASLSQCRAVSAVLDGSTWHFLVDASADGFYHFSGALASLTDHGQVFVGQGSGWEQFVRHPYIATTQIGGDWAVFYDGRQGSAQGEVGAVGVVFTSDFSTFTGRQQIIDTSDLWWEADDVGAPAVYYDGETWLMVYAGFASLGISAFPHYLGAATSSDGISWTKSRFEVPVLTEIRDGDTDERLNTPELFHDGSTLSLYFGDISPGEGIMRVEADGALLAFLTPSGTSAACTTATPAAACTTASPGVACSTAAPAIACTISA